MRLHWFPTLLWGFVDLLVYVMHYLQLVASKHLRLIIFKIPRDPKQKNLSLFSSENQMIDCYLLTNNQLIVSENSFPIVFWLPETNTQNIVHHSHPISKEIMFLEFCFVFHLGLLGSISIYQWLVWRPFAIGVWGYVLLSTMATQEQALEYSWISSTQMAIVTWKPHHGYWGPPYILEPSPTNPSCLGKNPIIGVLFVVFFLSTIKYFKAGVARLTNTHFKPQLFNFGCLKISLRPAFW